LTSLWGVNSPNVAPATDGCAVIAPRSVQPRLQIQVRSPSVPAVVEDALARLNKPVSAIPPGR
jgi:hypothetical protein